MNNTEVKSIILTVFVQIQDEGLKVRTRPPICGPQSVKTQRAWLSAHGEDWIVTHKAQTDKTAQTRQNSRQKLQFSLDSEKL